MGLARQRPRFALRPGCCANPPVQVFIAPVPASHKKGLWLASPLPAHGAPQGQEGDRRQVAGTGHRTRSTRGSRRCSRAEGLQVGTAAQVTGLWEPCLVCTGQEESQRRLWDSQAMLETPPVPAPLKDVHARCPVSPSNWLSPEANYEDLRQSWQLGRGLQCHKQPGDATQGCSPFFFQCKNNGHPVQGAASRARAKGGAALFGAWAILGTPRHRVLRVLKSYLSSEKPEKFTD